MQNADLNINNLNLSLQGKSIISNLSLNLRRSEIHTVVGLSGAGKSQLLRTLVGLNKCGSGLDTTISTRIVFQENNLIPWLSLKKNIELVTTASDKKINEMFNMLDLAQYMNYKPRQVSGGMQQRVSLIRALIDQCDLLLLDEPFSKLDVVNKQINYDVLLKLWKENSPTILMVTHDLDEAIYLSQRVSFFSKTEKKITYTKELPFSYPRIKQKIRQTSQYNELFDKLNELLQEDFNHASDE